MVEDPHPYAETDDGFRVHPNPCHVGWAGGCAPWSCLCKKDAGHEGRHVCICRSWTVTYHQSDGKEGPE